MEDESEVSGGGRNNQSNRRRQQGGHGREAKSWIRDSNVDFLDASAVRKVVSSSSRNNILASERSTTGGSASLNSSARARQKVQGGTDGFTIDANGRLVVPEEWELASMDKQAHAEGDMDEDSDADDNAMIRAKSSSQGQIGHNSEGPGSRKRGRGDEDEKTLGGVGDARTGPGAWNKKKKKSGPDRHSGDVSGAAYRSTKAGGDMKKGNVDPFAWVALDPKDMNKRFKNKGEKRFNKVVNAAKMGASIGKKLGKKSRKVQNEKMNRSRKQSRKR